MEFSESVKMLKAISDETRLKIFEMLRSGTLCACKILESLNITQPTLSHHMKILAECGIVKAEKDWKWTYYSLNCEKLKELIEFLGDVKCRKKDGKPCLAHLSKGEDKACNVKM